MSSVPVGTVNTVASASFFKVMSDVEPWPVRIRPSAAVYPIAALSPAAVSVVASNVPPVITPVVVIALEPLLIEPKPLVMLPASSAPVVTMLELPAAGDAAMSDNTSELARLSKPLAVNLAYSSSATELLSILTAFVFEMPNVRLA